MSFRATWALAKKDLLDALRTLRLLIFILLPIGFSLFYRAIFTSAGDVTAARVVIYDADKSRLTQVLAQAEGVRVIVVGSLEELRRVVVEARAVGGIVLPPGHDAALIAGKRPAIQLFVNGQLGVNSPQFIYMIEPALRTLAGQQLPARIETLIADASAQDVPRPGFDLERFLLIMFLTVGSTMTAIMVPASMLVEEKEQHTLRAVLTTPTLYTDFVAGKGIAGLVYALLSGLVILALNGGLSGSVGLTILVLLLTSFFLVEIGLLLGALFDSLAALNTWSFAILLPLTLPGVLVPATSLGLLDLGVANWVLSAIPTYYAVDAIQRTVSGAVSIAVGVDLLVLVTSALLLFAVTVMLLRRREK
jgi:ABC-2 type transport system permease protein